MRLKFYPFLALSFLLFSSGAAFAQCGDSCLNATPLTVTASGPCTYVNCTNDTASGATASHVPTLPCSGVDNNDVWYTFIVPAGVTQLVGEVHGLVMTDPIIYFYRGTCAALNSIGCNSGFPPASTASLNYTGFIPGERIWVRVKPLGGTPDGTFQLCVYNPCPGGPPANDNPCNATVVNMSPNCSTFTTVSTFLCYGNEWSAAPGLRQLHRRRCMDTHAGRSERAPGGKHPAANAGQSRTCNLYRHILLGSHPYCLQRRWRYLASALPVCNQPRSECYGVDSHMGIRKRYGLWNGRHLPDGSLSRRRPSRR
jgi:hypothetical protein